MNDTGYERYVYALMQFALGIALLGHGIAATVYADGVTPVTVGLPLVGSIVAYYSFVNLLPPESPLSAVGFLGLLGVLTAAMVNLAIPAVDVTTGLFSNVSSSPFYWSGFLVGFAGFTTLGVYELLAERLSGQHALAKLLGVGVVAIAIGVLLLVAPARPGKFLTPVDAMAGLGGAVLAVALFAYARTEAGATHTNEATRTTDTSEATRVTGANETTGEATGQ